MSTNSKCGFGLSSPLPPRALARGGEGSGVGGLLLTEFNGRQSGTKNPPTPVRNRCAIANRPSPPLRGGRAET
jgi:hypothetical protein